MTRIQTTSDVSCDPSPVLLAQGWRVVGVHRFAASNFARFVYKRAVDGNGRVVELPPAEMEVKSSAREHARRALERIERMRSE